MKNRLITFLFISLFAYSAHSQKIEIFLYMRNSCNQTIRQLGFYELTKDSKTIYYNSMIDTIPLTLRDTGNYILNSQYISGDVLLKINKYGLYIDTLIQSRIDKTLTIDSKPSFYGWICCNVKCNGYQIDYYNNGNKKIEGHFKKGKPIGILKFYTQKGILKSEEQYNKRGKFLSRKDL